jgi:NADH:ubiquinone oxidoreductase subunit 2 (subunit N)
MMFVASLPVWIVLGGGWITRMMNRSRGSRRMARALGASVAALALVVTLMLWHRGVRGATGTLDADPFSLYCSALLLGVLFVILAFSELDSAGISKLLIATVFLLLVASTRDLLWIGVALTLLTLSLLENKDVSAADGLAGFAFWAGTILLVSFGKGSDLAAIGASASGLPAKLGVGVTLVGVVLIFVVLNARSWALDEPLVLRGYLSMGVWIACTTVGTRIFAWLDVSFGTWYLIGGLLGGLALVVGGVGVLLSTRVARLCHWFVLAQAGFAFVAIGFGVEALAPLLLHLTSGGLALASTLLALEASSDGRDVELRELSGSSMGRLSGLVVALAWLSLASLPPFPGFISKFPIFVAAAGADRMGLLVVLLLSTLLVAVGCTRLISRALRAEPPAGSTRPGFAALALAVLALGFTLVLGVLPETAIEVASRAAAGLF